MKGEGKRILYVVNDADFFLSHRLPLAKAAQSYGYDVHVATPSGSGVERIVDEGFTFHSILLNRMGIRPFQEIKSLLGLYKLYSELQPALVHHVTIKPVLYGGMMARLARIPAVVSAVSGLGYVFIPRDFKAKLGRSSVKFLYRLALGHDNNIVIFQNPDDKNLFLESGMIAKGRVALIKGSGVDLRAFVPTSEPVTTPLIILASRMLWDKGVGEFVEAARLLQNAGLKARFALVGDTDPGNPAAVPTSQLEDWKRDGIVEWWGRRDDMPNVFAQAHIVCLPSYREGLPKVLIEAAASGRSIITTDVPGCREVVRDGENGLLVQMRATAALAMALRKLIEDPELRRRMGKKGRELAVAEFSVETVVNETLAIYRELIP